jgi:hypothetical protein
MGWTAEGSGLIISRSRRLSSPQRPGWIWDQPSLLLYLVQWIPLAVSPEVKRKGREADQSLASSAEVKMVATQFPQFALLHSVTCVQLRLITILGNCGCVAVASFLGVPSPLDPEYGGCMFFWNVCSHLLDCMRLHYSSQSPLREPQIQ